MGLLNRFGGIERGDGRVYISPEPEPEPELEPESLSSPSHSPHRVCLSGKKSGRLYIIHHKLYIIYYMLYIIYYILYIIYYIFDTLVYQYTTKAKARMYVYLSTCVLVAVIRGMGVP